MKKLALLLLLSAGGTCLGMDVIQKKVRNYKLQRRLDRLTKRLKACAGFKPSPSFQKYTNDAFSNEINDAFSNEIRNRSSMHKPCQKIRDEWVKVANELYPDREQE